MKNLFQLLKFGNSPETTRHPNHFQEMVQSVDGIIWEADAETFQFLYVSPQSEAILGYPPSCWYEDNSFWESHIHPDDRQGAISYCLREIEQGNNHAFEYRMIDAAGKIVWLRDLVTIVKEKDRPDRLRGLMIDITPQKKIENERDEVLLRLKENQRQLKSSYREKEQILERIGDAFFAVDKKGLVNYWSKKAEEIVGVSQKDIIGKNLWDVFPVARGLNFFSAYKRSLEEQVPVCFEEFYPPLDQSFEIRCYPSDEGLSIFFSDITEKKYYKDLENLERRIFELNSIGDLEISLIIREFILGIEALHPETICSVMNVTDGKLYNFISPNLSSGYLEAIEGAPIGKNAGTCGTAAYSKKLVITEDISVDPLWDDYRELVRDYGLQACWSQPVFNRNKEVQATFAVYYRKTRLPSDMERNTISRAVHILGVLFDSCEKERAEQQLAQSEQRFRTLVQDGSDLIAILDEEANYKYVAPTSEKVLGIPAEEFIGTNALNFIHIEDRERVIGKLEELTSTDRVVISPFRFLDSDGNWRWIETIVTNMMDNPAISGLVANSRDVTNKREEEQLLKDSLHEKEVLLMEIHHRVKNNLAVVSGLMHLQAFDTDSEELRQKLFNSVTRIKTMAVIHEMLYKSGNFSKIELGLNIEELVSTIASTYQSGSKIRFQFNLQQMDLNMNQAIPCSLVINEIISNIFKHAYTQDEDGLVSINLSEENGRINLEIIDDGKGLPENFNRVRESGTLGLHLVDTLAKQLDAVYEFKSLEEGRGVLFSIQFDNRKLKDVGNGFFNGDGDKLI